VTFGLFAAVALLYVLGASRADPGVAVAAEDLEIVRGWIESGTFPGSNSDSSHLAKPGYLLYLRATLPHAGSDSSENRRFLLFNAGWILLGLGAAAAALERRFGGVSACFFLVAMLACVTLRDSADYVASEPVATGLALLVLAGAVASARSQRVFSRLLLGASAMGIAFVRPNLGILVFVVLLLKALDSDTRKPAVLAISGGFALGFAVLFVVGRQSNLALQPFRAGVSRVLLWGTADYYWKPDVGGWPVGSTPEESAQKQLGKSVRRWKAFFTDLGENRRRALAWRFGHAFFSAEELPSRWPSPLYRCTDRFAREWWWVLATLLVVGAAAAAIGGTNGWRFVPALLVAGCIGQGLLFGADPRLALPILPILALALATSFPASGRRVLALAGSALVGAGCVIFVLRVPDVAAYDFALVRGSGVRIIQPIAASLFPTEGASAIHFRLAQEPPHRLGLVVGANERILLERRPGDPSPWPAFLTVPLDERETARARREGLTLRIETTGGPGASAAFVYYPVIPPVLGGRSTVDGSEQIPSGFGGETSGGLPVWVTSAGPSPRAQSTRVKAGKSVMAILRKAPSMA
jgi:hypothetical protein